MIASEPYGDIRPAKVRTAGLRQHDVYMLDEGRTLLLGVALSPPRLWTYLLDVTLIGFLEGYEQPHDGRPSTRMHQGLRCAQQRLRARAEALIERRPPDVGLLVLSVEGSVLHILAAGPLRAFVHQHRSRRLGPREESGAGILKGPSSWSAEQVAAGELVYAGSLSACTPESVGEVDSLLSVDPAAPAQEVVEVLNRTAASNGLAALAVAMRVPTP
jgi:hypothetical protein